MTKYRAEHVGSLLRPPELLAARAAHARGELTKAELRELEDRAALANLAMQREAGIEVFTEGEVRRGTFMAGLMESLGGVTPVDGTGDAVQWHRADGAPSADELEFEAVAANAPLFQKESLTSTEAAFLGEHAPGRFKITMMSASMGAGLWHPALSTDVYPSPVELLGDVVRLQVEEVEGLVERGVSWIQLDSLSYNWIIDDELRVAFEASTGMGSADMLNMTIAMDSQVVAAAKAKNPDVTVALHFCRGNNRSAWMAEGSYEPVAERLFGEVGVDRFLLEYDTERAGGFEPLRFVPAGTDVVLGLVSSKLPELESADDLAKRIDEASEYIPLDNLALSPQCGFASTASGNLLTVAEQRAKLALIAETARKVWG